MDPLGEPRLVVVRRGHFATFELLTRTFADDPDVRIIWDRRIRERRKAGDAEGQWERRRARERRRVPPPEWSRLNYMFASGPSA